MTPATKLAIGLPLSLLCLCFILTAVVSSPQNHRKHSEKTTETSE